MQKVNDRIFVPIIWVLSIVIPIVVAVLLFVDRPKLDLLGNIDFLPTLNAIINSTVAVLLIVGWFAIRKKKVKLHRLLMGTAFLLSILFLVSYVIYHWSAQSVKYNGDGLLRGIYLFTLLTHILLSVAVVPLALLAIYRGITNQIQKHRKIVKWTWPIWLYVSITGVFVYLMAHIYNPNSYEEKGNNKISEHLISWNDNFVTSATQCTMSDVQDGSVFSGSQKR